MYEVKMVGGLLFVRVGSFGGSVYVKRKDHWIDLPVAFAAGCVVGLLSYAVLRTVGLV
jgi:hypothetical protein